MPAYNYHKIIDYYPRLKRGTHYGFCFGDWGEKEGKSFSIEVDFHCLLASHFLKRPWIDGYFKDVSKKRWYISEYDHGQTLTMREIPPKSLIVRIGEYKQSSARGGYTISRRLLLSIKDEKLDRFSHEVATRTNIRQETVSKGTISTAKHVFSKIKKRTLETVSLLKQPGELIYLDDYRKK